MFTGLINGVGRLLLHKNGLKIENECSAMELCLGDSIAVDGVCLTVAELTPSGFLADVSEETLKKTSLGIKAQRNGFVNLEPAIRLSDRLGGHLVSGHVDGLGKIESIESLDKSWILRSCWENKSFGKYICEKASITLNGISLTVAECTDDGTSFAIAIIPHTWNSTTLKYLQPGEMVNLEVDLMAKYAESLLKNATKTIENSSSISSNDISKSWLEDYGWG